MLIDARSCSDGDRIETDLCIVGAGPAGLAIAKTLTGRGFRICVIESGSLEPDIEEQQAAVRDLSVGRNIGLNYFRLEEARGRGFGGSSTRWNVPIDDGMVGVRLRPLEPIDFEARGWLPNSGWPFSRDHLEPYYRRAATLCGIEPQPPGSDDCVQGNGPLPLNPSIVDTAIFQIGPANVWWGQQTLADLDKAGTTVLINGTATRINASEDAQRVTGVRVGTLAGKSVHVVPKVVVLSAGGIDNARLLLLSDTARNGSLGNGRDLVGRYFMEHPHLTAGVLIPNGPDAFQKTARYQLQKSGSTWTEGRLALAEPTVRRERLRGFSVALHAFPRKGSLQVLETLQSPSGGDAAVTLIWAALERGVWPYDLRTLTREMAKDPAGALHAVGRRLKRKRRATGKRASSDAAPNAQPEVFALNVMAEQEPNPDSRVLLDHRNADALGQPRARLDWRLTERDMRAISRGLELIGRELEAAGLGRFHTPLHPTLPPSRLKGGYHHMGTTRMHVDPAHGVVNADCRVHGVDNLYMAGSSVFPTGGYANPTFTVVALAVRLADHLARRFS